VTTVHPFDLQARIELAIHALTALPDGTRQGQMYFLADWRARPPRADGLMRFALKHMQGYSPDGRLHARQGGALQAHFHTRSAFILGTLKLGLITGRREFVAWARQSYHFAGEWGAEFGWFPEHLGQRHGEICGTVDMIEIALLLGRHVDRAYYADVERFGRNHLLESQWLGLEQLRQATARLPEARAAAPNDGRYSTREGVIESQVGGFASRPALNDAFHADATDLMQCCNASGLRALCDLWTHAVEHQPARPEALPMEAVHLHFSVETPSLRVVSYVPAQGRLDLLPRHDCRLAMRLPCGQAQALVVRGSDTGPNVQALHAENGYIELEAAAGEPVEVHFHLPERVAHYQVGSPGCEARCMGTWRGETLMRVEPAGQYAPLYDRRPDTPPVQPAPTAGAPIPSL